VAPNWKMSQDVPLLRPWTSFSVLMQLILESSEFPETSQNCFYLYCFLTNLIRKTRDYKNSLNDYENSMKFKCSSVFPKNYGTTEILWTYKIDWERRAKMSNCFHGHRCLSSSESGARKSSPLPVSQNDACAGGNLC